ncbi:MAG: hypothetical protein K2J63_12040 [Muribaculaceae bacterium]|nr:hypothetical protein [Muribaculaceae bacterium]MDE6796018.1 hypothetical protein [Muribaculaceae bacterium]
MKKVILSLAVIFSVAMVSCGGKKAAEADSAAAAVEVAGEVVEGVDSVNVGDSTVVDTVVAAAVETAAAQ